MFKTHKTWGEYPYRHSTPGTIVVTFRNNPRVLLNKGIWNDRREIQVWSPDNGSANINVSAGQYSYLGRLCKMIFVDGKTPVREYRRYRPRLHRMEFKASSDEIRLIPIIRRMDPENFKYGFWRKLVYSGFPNEKIIEEIQVKAIADALASKALGETVQNEVIVNSDTKITDRGTISMNFDSSHNITFQVEGDITRAHFTSPSMPFDERMTQRSRPRYLTIRIYTCDLPALIDAVRNDRTIVLLMVLLANKMSRYTRNSMFYSGQILRDNASFDSLYFALKAAYYSIAQRGRFRGHSPYRRNSAKKEAWESMKPIAEFLRPMLDSPHHQKWLDAIINYDVHFIAEAIKA